MFENYYVYRGKRYGVLNETRTPLGDLPILLWNMLKGIPFFFGVWLVLEGAARITDSGFFEFLGMLVCFGVLVYVGYFFACFHRSMGGRKGRTCLYCTASMEEMDQHIAAFSEKNPCYREMGDVIAEDGWYMLFSKDGKVLQEIVRN